MRLARLGPIFAGVAVALSAGILLLVLVLGGRIRPGMFSRQKPSKVSKVRAPRTFSKEPLTQPVKGLSPPTIRSTTREDSARRVRWMNRLHWPQRQVAVHAHAFLTRLSAGDEGEASPIPISSEEIKIGRDGFKATLLLDDPSLEGVHALLKKEDITYRLADMGTIAGTWVNYTPVSGEGVLLEHGDIIHIGRVGFRFILNKPENYPKLVVEKKEPSS
jgi:hypothetical protein